MRTSNISAITASARDVVSKVQICEHFLTQAHTYETSVNGETAVCYWIITTRQNAVNEQ